MGQRAYLIIAVKPGTTREQFVNVVRELEAAEGVDYVDPVKGYGNLVVMLDAPVSLEATVRAIKEKEWVKDLEVMMILSVREQHAVFSRVMGKEEAA